MARSIAEIEKEIRALAPEDRELLLISLFDELDGPPDAEVEREWTEELRRRRREFETGLAPPIPAEEVFRDLRRALEQ